MEYRRNQSNDRSTATKKSLRNLQMAILGFATAHSLFTAIPYTTFASTERTPDFRM